MLFSNTKACFSPSVSRSVRKAWVMHGGTLTHSPEDFRQAKYIFCEGIADSWLTELSSRSLVVLHASWVLKAVSEQFLISVSKYVLDDFFDLSKLDQNFLYPLIPDPDYKSLNQPKLSAQPLPKQIFISPKRNQSPSSKILLPANAKRHRPSDTSDTDLDTRPLKKTRFQSDVGLPETSGDAIPPTTDAGENPPTPLETDVGKRVYLSTKDDISQGVLHVPIASRIPRHNPLSLPGKAKAKSDPFKALIRKIPPPDETPRSEAGILPFQTASSNPHAAFWQEARVSQDINEITVSISKLVHSVQRAPPIHATLWAAEKTHLDEEFRCISTD